ncbi:hypothetical protein P4S83_03795 [Aneurinibacillus thermoaerophilus]|uniref:hypothetical protein n=1 Tax=Aneurinibacillus thermoaerophilus TaxID=143495 RepID=UPI002E20804E|nr:hypothetical protein [Aneurinibacillus thermoaerophilus]MED0678499.1 hypothetical protein [Aneurinibacillus thermoaerophilus]MED0763025.1 hypothetical protein [Aneurinibacillus thermoaerophilus]
MKKFLFSLLLMILFFSLAIAFLLTKETEVIVAPINKGSIISQVTGPDTITIVIP